MSDHEDAGLGTPPWLISFGDMMTLFLCFFIVLVTMAPVRDAGLIADGLGSFVSNSLETGRDGALASAALMASRALAIVSGEAGLSRMFTRLRPLATRSRCADRPAYR